MVALGLVERREVPPSALFRVVADHVAVRAVVALARAREVMLEEVGRQAAKLPGPPVSVIVFGSLARGDGGPESDIDVVVVRPDCVGEDADDWRRAIEAWRADVRRVAGSAVDVVEVGEVEVARLLRSRRPMWRDVRRDGIVVYGSPLAELRAA